MTPGAIEKLREALLTEANKTQDRDTALVLEELARDIPGPVPCVECERHKETELKLAAVIRGIHDGYGEIEARVRKEALEEAVNLALRPYGDEVAALGTDQPLAVGAKIARAIAALSGSKDKNTTQEGA